MMIKQVKQTVGTFMLSVASIVMLTGCVLHAGASKAHVNVSFDKDYSSVNKSLRIDDGKNVGDVSTVNGSLKLEDNVVANEVSSVNGRLKVGENVSVDELSTVNGSLSAGNELKVSEDVSTVNGKISLNKDSVVKGNVISVNGKISLEGVTVNKNIETVNASITLTNNSKILGDIVYEGKKRNNYNKNKPVLSIDASSTVAGSIIVDLPVEFDFEDKSLMDKVVKNY